MKLVISALTLNLFDYSEEYVLLTGIGECLVLGKVKISMPSGYGNIDSKDIEQEHASNLKRLAGSLSHAKLDSISWNFSNVIISSYIYLNNRMFTFLIVTTFFIFLGL